MSNIFDLSTKKKKEVYKKYAYDFAAAPAEAVSDLSESDRLEVAGTLDLQNKLISNIYKKRLAH